MGIGDAAVSDLRETSEAGAVAQSAGPVFVDATGRRSRTWRRAGAVTALCCVCYATTVAASLVGGDSTAPFLQLPRAMGLERGTDEPSAPVEDEERTVSATGPVLGMPGPSTPGPVLLGPMSPGRAQPSTAAEAAAPRPAEPSPGPADTPSASGAGSGSTHPAPEPTAQDGGEGEGPAPVTEPSEPTPAPEPEPEAEETTAPGGQLGDLLGGVLGGLLGRH